MMAMLLMIAAGGTPLTLLETVCIPSKAHFKTAWTIKHKSAISVVSQTLQLAALPRSWDPRTKWRVRANRRILRETFWPVQLMQCTCVYVFTRLTETMAGKYFIVSPESGRTSVKRQYDEPCKRQCGKENVLGS